MTTSGRHAMPRHATPGHATPVCLRVSDLGVQFRMPPHRYQIALPAVLSCTRLPYDAVTPAKNVGADGDTERRRLDGHAPARVQRAWPRPRRVVFILENQTSSQIKNLSANQILEK